MSTIVAPLLLALFGWWFSTGIILYLNHLPRHTYRWSMAGATIVFLACLHGLGTSAAQTEPMAAVIAFTQALLVWAWLEMSYFMGFITGSIKQTCPDGCSGMRRFALALRASIHHEIAVVATAMLIIAITWAEPNQFGTGTFLILWLMRWSAKLNLFLGVPNFNTEWFPSHLRYLSSYIATKPMNLFFPISVTLSTTCLAALALKAGTAAAGFEQTGYTLLATLIALAILEHWFLVLPLRDSALWNFALRAAEKRAVKRRGGPSKQSATRAG